VKTVTSIVETCKEDMLAWVQQKDDYDGLDSEAESDSLWKPMGDELLDVLDEILTAVEAREEWTRRLKASGPKSVATGHQGVIYGTGGLRRHDQSRL
jgi:hypothetical protein